MRGRDPLVLVGVGLVMAGCHSSNSTVRNSSPTSASVRSATADSEVSTKKTAAAASAGPTKAADAIAVTSEAPPADAPSADGMPAQVPGAKAPQAVVQTVSAAPVASSWSRLLGAGGPPQRVALPRNDLRAENRSGTGGGSDENSEDDF